MENYFNYLREMVLAFFENFARWMNTRWAVPWAAVPDDFARYGIIFDNFASGFGFWGWFFFVLFAIFFVAAIGALVFLIYWLLRKYIKFYRTDAVNDSPEVMAYFKTNPSVDDILRKSDFWGMDLTTIPGFADFVKAAL